MQDAGGESPMRPPARPGRDLALFVLGPGLLACAVAAAFAVHPWPVPYAVQARSYDFRFLGPMLALGALGVWLSSRAGPPSAPAFRDGRAWGRLLIASLLMGLAMLATSVFLDETMGLSRVNAEVIGQRSVNVPFPASLAHYAFGTVIEECMAHLIPIPLLCGLIGGLILRGRHRLTVFWIVAALASLLEPAGQAMPLAGRAPALAMIVAATEYVGNLVLAWLFLRFGWPALIVTRLVQELTWHVAWPLVSGG
jgi:hypothetical protein